MIPVLETQHTGNQDVELLQQNTKRFVKVLEDNPLLDGRLIEDIDVPAATLGGPSAFRVEHKLDRLPRGWIVTDTDEQILIFRTGWDRKYIDFANGSPIGDAVVDMWVF